MAELLVGGWDYEARSAEVDAERALWFVQKQQGVLSRTTYQPTLNDPRATGTQIELFGLIGRAGYEFVESLIAKLPSKRMQEHFRQLYLREYHDVKDDGSLAFQFGERQRFHANIFLRELLEERLGKVFAQYQFDLRWLSLSMAEKWQWAQAELVRANMGLDYAEMVVREHEKPTEDKKTLPFYLMTESRLAVIADHLSYIFLKIQTDFFTQHAHLAEQGKAYSDADLNALAVECYRQVGVLCEAIGLPLPYWATFSEQDGNAHFKPNQKSIEVALNKSACEKYWLKALKKAQKQMVEHLAIACGEVRAGVAPYVSNQGFSEWKAQKKKNFEFLEKQILLNIDNEEEQVELLEMYKRSSSNPSIRHQEMMNCLNGIETWAEENGHQALFLTLTAPSSFHAQHSKGGQNKKWQGASPKQTQAYLNKVWAQFRALLKKRAINFYGMRVAEPHHDGTPHWHLLLYVAQAHIEEVETLFKDKALEIDGDERGAKEHRAKVERCDKSKGSATAYIVKYISKNLGGKKDVGHTSDEVDGLSFKDNASRVRAWASCWGIRQFQFYGVSSIGVWRELRRLTAGQCLDQSLEEIRLGADLGDYAFYLDKQGGGGAPREKWVAKLVYDETQENKYGQKNKRIVGIKAVFSAISDWVKTRLKKWKIVPKTRAKASRSEAQTSGHSPAWTCVSNCNPSQDKALTADSGAVIDDYLQTHAHQVERLKMAFSWRGIDVQNFNKHHIFSLLQGGEVSLIGQDYARFDGYEVQIHRKRSDFGEIL
ncbi:hypothetical protein A4G19_08470 [Pasteurellaceae bacterium Macca]|nr:hypothetical protein [Pasteurellaceae bacterium Macca]